MLYETAQEDFLHSGGLKDSDFYENLFATIKARLKWLSFSIFGSFCVALIIDSFNVKNKAQLIGMMTIIMSISSVAGMQVVTIILRALLNRELNIINAKRTFIKEIIVALINGLILGIFFGLIFGIKMDYRFGILIVFSLLISMIWSAIAGTLFPLVFNKLGIDPALSSGALLACSIDAFAACSFLLIAKYIFL